ncbi:unnamed protein product [Paramecium primaurelia]|uniref:Uncharacterized protein n=1 Tax=Paramecium primaurelia TaxID=5886 RepID=A0A8S1LPF0_PARPR|nr:unnamed protein product [Paramecium primaurelia]
MNFESQEQQGYLVPHLAFKEELLIFEQFDYRVLNKFELNLETQND